MRWKKGDCVGFRGTGNTAIVEAVHGGSVTLRSPAGERTTLSASGYGYLIKKRKTACRWGGGLRGVSADEPLNMAQFIVGRAPGERVGAVYKSGQRPACRVGEGLKIEKGVIPFKTARNAFLRARAHFLGGEAIGGAGATTLTAHGDWRDPVTGKVYDEPTFIGQVIWHKNKYEPTPQVFRDQMKKMCEDVACRLAQREIILRLDNGLTTTITRCTPRGKPPLDHE